MKPWLDVFTPHVNPSSMMRLSLRAGLGGVVLALVLSCSEQLSTTETAAPEVPATQTPEVVDPIVGEGGTKEI